MRVAAALIFLAAVVAFLALAGHQQDPRPLLIDAAIALDPRGGPPFAIADQNALYTVCPTTPRNVPAVKRNVA